MVAIVTGANTGLGFATALALARAGSEVVMACRTPTKCDAAAASIRQQTGSSTVHTFRLDLSDLRSVRSFADDFQSKFDRLDLLINNAGIMMVKVAFPLSCASVIILSALPFAFHI